MMMFGFLICFVVTVSTCLGTTTLGSTTSQMTLPPLPATIYYDFAHNTAMIVRADGCYEYHLNHEDEQDAMNDDTRAILEARMLEELSRAINIEEMGHNHVNHMTQDIVDACASLPVYSWDTTL